MACWTTRSQTVGIPEQAFVCQPHQIGPLDCASSLPHRSDAAFVASVRPQRHAAVRCSAHRHCPHRLLKLTLPMPPPARRFSPTRLIRRHALRCLRSASPRRQINAIRSAPQTTTPRAHAFPNRLLLLRPTSHRSPRRASRCRRLPLPPMSAPNWKRLRRSRKLQGSVHCVRHCHRVRPHRRSGGQVQVQVLPDLRNELVSHRGRVLRACRRRSWRLRRPSLPFTPGLRLRLPPPLMGSATTWHADLRQGPNLNSGRAGSAAFKWCSPGPCTTRLSR